MEGCHRRPAVDSWSKFCRLEHGLQSHIMMAPPCSTHPCLHALLFASAPTDTCSWIMEGSCAHSCGSRSAPGEQGVERSPAPLLPRAKVETDTPWIWNEPLHLSNPLKWSLNFRKKPLRAASSTIFTPYSCWNQRQPSRTLIKHEEETLSLLTISVIIAS